MAFTPEGTVEFFGIICEAVGTEGGGEEVEQQPKTFASDDVEEDVTAAIKCLLVDEDNYSTKNIFLGQGGEY